jgi:hypothetical protein
MFVRTAQFCRSTKDVLKYSLSGSPLIHVPPFREARFIRFLRAEMPRWTHPSFARH